MISERSCGSWFPWDPKYFDEFFLELLTSPLTGVAWFCLIIEGYLPIAMFSLVLGSLYGVFLTTEFLMASTAFGVISSVILYLVYRKKVPRKSTGIEKFVEFEHILTYSSIQINYLLFIAAFWIAKLIACRL